MGGSGLPVVRVDSQIAHLMDLLDGLRRENEMLSVVGLGHRYLDVGHPYEPIQEVGLYHVDLERRTWVL
jgi:hypothetical protein